MADYIEREAARLAVMRAGYIENILPTLEAVPAADVAPVVHGRWIEHEFEDEPCFGTDYECSACGKFQYEDTRYCPNCGAKMDGDN